MDKQMELAKQAAREMNKRRAEIKKALGDEIYAKFEKAHDALNEAFLTEQNGDYDWDKNLSDEQYNALNAISSFFYSIENP